MDSAKSRKSKSYTFKKFNWEELNDTVIGVDEVGRGCLAGRVYAAAVILSPHPDNKLYGDSKLLTEIRREELSKSIFMHHQVGIGFASVDEIDRVNIFQATFLAMKRALKNLGVTRGHVLVDGKFPIPGLIGFEQTPLIKGDQRASPISAASIVAKVTRDHYMADLSKKYKNYDFEIHKGYATETHRERIAQFGPCIEHRKTFKGVSEYISSPLQGIEI